jgi:hypothetical protein
MSESLDKSGKRVLCNLILQYTFVHTIKIALPLLPLNVKTTLKHILLKYPALIALFITLLGSVFHVQGTAGRATLNPYDQSKCKTCYFQAYNPHTHHQAIGVSTTTFLVEETEDETDYESDNEAETSYLVVVVINDDVNRHTYCSDTAAKKPQFYPLYLLFHSLKVFPV